MLAPREPAIAPNHNQTIREPAKRKKKKITRKACCVKACPTRNVEAPRAAQQTTAAAGAWRKELICPVCSLAWGPAESKVRRVRGVWDLDRTLAAWDERSERLVSSWARDRWYAVSDSIVSRAWRRSLEMKCLAIS